MDLFNTLEWHVFSVNPSQDEEVSTPVDPIDPFIAFSDAIRLLQSQHPARFQVCCYSCALLQPPSAVHECGSPCSNLGQMDQPLCP